VRRFGGLIAAILIGAVLLLWAWNTVATELLGAPQAGFRHGLAFAAAVAGVAVLIAIAKSLAGAGFSRHGGGDQAR
jgi:tetrahydromethanopterin S-methyltransferase subunit E